MAKSTRSPADAVRRTPSGTTTSRISVRHDDRTVAFDPLDPAGEDILAAEKFGDVAVLRLVIDVAGRSGLLDLAFFHHHDDVSDRNRFELGVRDVDEGDPEITLHPAEFLPHLHPQLFVERRQRLVQQQHFRAGDRRRAPARRVAADRPKAAPATDRQVPST